MTRLIDLTYWDSCVFLSYLEDFEDRASTIEAALDEVRRYSRERRIVTSILSISEVSYLTGHPDDEALIDTLWNNTAIIGLIEIHEGIARAARGLVRSARRNSLALQGADAIHLATAHLLAVQEFCTYERYCLVSYPTASCVSRATSGHVKDKTRPKTIIMIVLP